MPAPFFKFDFEPKQRQTFIFFALVVTVIALSMYLTVKICEQAAGGGVFDSAASLLEYGTLAGKYLLFFLVLSWMVYTFCLFAYRYRVLRREYRELENSLDETKQEVNRLFSSALNTLAAAVQARDEGSLNHLKRIASYSFALGRRIGMSSEELSDVYCAALLHDLGKIGISDSILKKPAKLSLEEFAEVRRHPEIGTRILEKFVVSKRVTSIIRHHHEFYDGTGYPGGLAKSEIPLGARIIAITDAYDAMTSDRPYRSALSHEEAVAELIRCAGSQFDPRLVMHFLDVLEEERKDGLQPAEVGAFLPSQYQQLFSLIF